MCYRVSYLTVGVWANLETLNWLIHLLKTRISMLFEMLILHIPELFQIIFIF